MFLDSPLYVFRQSIVCFKTVYCMFLDILLYVFADINECDIGTHNCNGIGAICINHPGGFHCECESGYTGNGTVCTGRLSTKLNH